MEYAIFFHKTLVLLVDNLRFKSSGELEPAIVME